MRWVPFGQFKKREKHPWRSVFHVFKIVQMVPNPQSITYAPCWSK